MEDLEIITKELLEVIESHPAVISLIVCFISLIFGAVMTNIINGKAMRRQCQFNLIYEYLRKEHQCVDNLQRDISSISMQINIDGVSIDEVKTKLSKVTVELNELDRRFQSLATSYYKYIPDKVMIDVANMWIRWSDFYPIILFSDMKQRCVTVEFKYDVVTCLFDFSKKLRAISKELYWAEEAILNPGIVSSLCRRMSFRIRMKRLSRGFKDCGRNPIFNFKVNKSSTSEDSE